MSTEQKAVQACFTTLGPRDPETVRAVIIEDTLHVSDFLASTALRPELETMSRAEISETFHLDSR